MKYIAFAFIIFLCFSCQKEKDDNPELKYLDIEDAYGLVLGKYISGADTANKIFKLNSKDNLEEVKYLKGDKSEINFSRIPVAIYDLNATHFLITFKYGNQEALESYLIRKFDGSSQKLTQKVIPEHLGKPDLRNDVIRHDNNSGFYFTNSAGNWKLNLSDEQYKMEEILKGEDLGDNFKVDYQGNIITDSKIYPVNGAVTTLKNINSSYVYPLESFVNSMYYIFRNGDSIQCSKVNVSSDISEENLLPSLNLTSDEAEFIASHAFPEINKILVILSKAIFQIDGNRIQKVNLLNLNLTRIISGCCSGNYCFIYGENTSNEKVFVRIDPRSPNPVFTQMLAPDEVEVHHFSVSSANNLLFSGTRLSDSKKLFGYIPFEGNNWIIDDDEGISELQLLVR